MKKVGKAINDGFENLLLEKYGVSLKPEKKVSEKPSKKEEPKSLNESLSLKESTSERISALSNALGFQLSDEQAEFVKDRFFGYYKQPEKYPSLKSIIIDDMKDFGVLEDINEAFGISVVDDGTYGYEIWIDGCCISENNFGYDEEQEAYDEGLQAVIDLITTGEYDDCTVGDFDIKVISPNIKEDLASRDYADASTGQQKSNTNTRSTGTFGDMSDKDVKEFQDFMKKKGLTFKKDYEVDKDTETDFGFERYSKKAEKKVSNVLDAISSLGSLAR